MAIICEMFHTSSLLHDDVIDHAETRRGKISVNTKWSQASSIQAGVYVLSVSTRLLAQTENPDVIESMSQILYDLVNGEFQQMTSRWEHITYCTGIITIITLKQSNITDRTKMIDFSSISTRHSTRRPV